MDLNWIEEEIAQSQVYLNALEKVAARELRPNAKTEELLTLLQDPDTAATRLAEWARSADPLFKPHKQISLDTGDKVRTIYTIDWPYRIVLMALQDLFAKRLEPLYSNRLYSYRKGLGTLNAHRAFHQFLKKHKAIWVAKRDITGFGESIVPSILFQKMEAVFPRKDLPRFYRLMDQAIKARYIDATDGTEKALTMGIPSGSPLTPVLENLYLMELDQKMDELCKAHPDCFYARYGDDFVFSSPNPEFFHKTITEIDAFISTLGLTYSEKKKVNCELGRSTHYLEWLGASFMSGGRIAPRPKHFRQNYQAFKKSFHALLQDLSKMVGPYSESKTIFQAAIKEFLSERSNPALSKILFNRNDESITKTLDHNIRILLVRWLSYRFKMKKSEAWRELKLLQIPSLNYQRRFRWKL